MLLAEDFRRIARNSLRGKWGLAVGTGLVATLLGANGVSSNSVIERTQEQLNFGPLHSFIIIFLATWAVIYFIIGGAMGLGYCHFNLNLIRDDNPQFSNLFSRFHILWKALGMRLLITLYTFLGMLLFIIPGIIISFSYSMAPFILSEHPEMDISEAMSLSKEMMNGYKWRYFCLYISFIGWLILSAFTFGVGLLFLNPYINAAEAAFYQDLKDSEF